MAIVGEAPTVGSDLSTFRSCFGSTGTALKMHNAGSIRPILESSLDAMVVSMVAPQLERFDLWVHPISEEDDDGDVLGFLHLLAQPVQATSNGAPLPHVISVSYGVCESTVKSDSASRTIAERQLKASAALGITVVVAAGDTGSSACAHGVPANKLTSADKKLQVSWPASSSWVLAVGGTNLTLNAANGIAATGVWNDTAYPFPYTATAGGGGGQSTIVKRPWWQPAQSFATSGNRMVPDVAAFADESPGYAIVCSGGVQGCPGGGQTIAYVGGTSASTPLVAGMIALWTQQARAKGLPRPGFVPPLLYSLARKQPQAFVDITQGDNALFGGSCCPARPGYDLATGWGSPLANVVAALLPGTNDRGGRHGHSRRRRDRRAPARDRTASRRVREGIPAARLVGLVRRLLRRSSERQQLGRGNRRRGHVHGRRQGHRRLTLKPGRELVSTLFSSPVMDAVSLMINGHHTTTPSHCRPHRPSFTPPARRPTRSASR